MDLEHLPDIIADDPTIQALACLYAADRALNQASLALRCALHPDIIAATGVADLLGGLPPVIRSLHATHIAINALVDSLSIAIEFASPIPQPTADA